MSPLKRAFRRDPTTLASMNVDISRSREPLNVELLKEKLLQNGDFGQVIYEKVTGSTNADLLELASSGAPNWTVKTVEFQDHARGRLGRPWSAPEGSQTIVSVLVQLSTDQLDRIGTIPLAAGLAVMDALNDLGVEGAGLKWPNDVQIHGKKLCGILVEATGFDSTPTVVIGWGTNISLTKEELPVPHATSLALEGVEVDRTTFLINMLTHLHTRLDQWQGPSVDWLDDYRAVCSSIGQDVRVLLPGDKELLGEAIGVATGGEIRVRDASGTVHTLNAGEITHLRLQ
ncbi:biotin--protein ligase [Corynebacterium glutamicum ZL-2]|nr:biotin--protein ligase [Corynebacterium glutamicum ZL-2]